MSLTAICVTRMNNPYDDEILVFVCILNGDKKKYIFIRSLEHCTRDYKELNSLSDLTVLNNENMQHYVINGGWEKIKEYKYFITTIDMQDTELFKKTLQVFLNNLTIQFCYEHLLRVDEATEKSLAITLPSYQVKTAHKDVW